MHNLSLEIVDVDAFLKLKKATAKFERLMLEMKALQKVQFPVMTSEMSQQIRNFLWPTNDYVEFGIDINSLKQISVPNPSAFQSKW